MRQVKPRCDESDSHAVRRSGVDLRESRFIWPKKLPPEGRLATGACGHVMRGRTAPEPEHPSKRGKIARIPR